MNIEFIRNPQLLEQFIETVLTNTSDTEVYQIQLRLRKKYGAEKDKLIGTRFVKKADVVRTVCRLSQLVRPDELNQAAMYISPAKICLKKAYKTLAEGCIEVMANQSYNVNPVALVESSLAKSPAKKAYLHFDYDVERAEVYNLVNDATQLLREFQAQEAHFIYTRGGFHLLAKLNAHVNNSPLIAGLKALGADANASGISLVPIPGTLQGGFETSFHSHYFY